MMKILKLSILVLGSLTLLSMTLVRTSYQDIWEAPAEYQNMENPYWEYIHKTLSVMDLDGLTIYPYRCSLSPPDEPSSTTHHKHCDHSHGGPDPHIWLDPKNMQLFARALKESFETRAPAFKSVLEKNHAILQKKLDRLDDTLQATLQS